MHAHIIWCLNFSCAHKIYCVHADSLCILEMYVFSLNSITLSIVKLSIRITIKVHLQEFVI